MVIEAQNNIMLEQRMKRLEKAFSLNDQQLKEIIKIQKSEMVKGLSGANSGSSLSMLSSYVTDLPNGTEKGSYMALDLGGTNFRVMLIKLNKSKIEITSEVFLVSEDVKVGESDAFFDHIAKCMAGFCENYGLKKTRLLVGFTFSFPLTQKSLDRAILLKWTKAFQVKGVEGNDVVEMLHEAIKRRGDLQCEVVAVVNDTVGTLVSCVLEEPDCKVGLIVGTGLNACYMEKVSNVKTIKQHLDAEHVCVNTELGGLGSNGLLEDFRNKYDKEVEEQSAEKGQQLYEKMVSGKYLGEIVRHVLCDLAKESYLFKESSISTLLTKNSFPTAFVSEIEKKSKCKDLEIENILSIINVSSSKEDREIVSRVCHLVSKRAAHLSAAAITAIVQKIEENDANSREMKITVGVDGTVYKKHPKFSHYMSKKAEELCADSKIIVKFVESHDGSGKGAALIAAALSEKV